MKQKAPAILSFIGALMFLGMWYIYLFVAQPDGQILSGATEQLKYSFDSGADHFNFFALFFLSSTLCFLYSAMLWFYKYQKFAIVLLGVNTILSLVFFSWSTALIIAMPLLYTKQIFQDA